jgi:hypothetical protein
MTLALRPRAALADEGGERNGHLSVTKECSAYTGAAASFCTITSSNLAEVQVGSKVYYSQAAVDPSAPEGGYVALDSNVVLYVGTGDWAVGRCTLDLTFRGLCTFSNGTGQLTGLHARVDVSPIGGVDYSWDGTYSFGAQPHK